MKFILLVSCYFQINLILTKMEKNRSFWVSNGPKLKFFELLRVFIYVLFDIFIKEIFNDPLQHGFLIFNYQLRDPTLFFILHSVSAIDKYNALLVNTFYLCTKNSLMICNMKVRKILFHI